METWSGINYLVGAQKTVPGIGITNGFICKASVRFTKVPPLLGGVWYLECWMTTNVGDAASQHKSL